MAEIDTNGMAAQTAGGATPARPGAAPSFPCGVTLTHATAAVVWRAGVAHIEAGASQVDCAGLRHFDSSALAVLLGWRRAAQARGVPLQFLNFPAQLASLAGAYGIASLLQERHPDAGAV